MKDHINENGSLNIKQDKELLEIIGFIKNSNFEYEKCSDLIALFVTKYYMLGFGDGCEFANTNLTKNGNIKKLRKN